MAAQLDDILDLHRVDTSLWRKIQFVCVLVADAHDLEWTDEARLL
jgi:hypothetical protein